MTLALVCAAVPAGAKTVKTTKTVVVGGYVNDIACIPNAAPTVVGEEIFLSCLGGSIWDGAWTGHTQFELHTSYDLEGNAVGHYRETLHGVYLPDGSAGSITFEGTIWIDGPSTQFYATSKIVGGTCAFAGSSGTATASGQEVNGSYRAEWYRPYPAPETDPTCAASL
jgi:hypothetical protein